MTHERRLFILRHVEDHSTWPGDIEPEEIEIVNDMAVPDFDGVYLTTLGEMELEDNPPNPTSMTHARLLHLVLLTKYKDWKFHVEDLHDRLNVSGSGWFVKVIFMAPDNDVPGSDPVSQTGRKWYISPHMTDGEVVQTLFLAVKVAEEHEMRELFTFRDQRVFGPHFDIEKLADYTAATSEKHRS